MAWTRKEVIEYYNDLDDYMKIMIDEIMSSTMNLCSELLNEPLYFKNSEDYDNFRIEMLYHLFNREYYDYDSKKWIKISSPIPQNPEYIIN